MKYHREETGPGEDTETASPGNFSVPVFKLVLPMGPQKICPVYHLAHFEVDNKIYLNLIWLQIVSGVLYILSLHKHNSWHSVFRLNTSSMIPHPVSSIIKKL